MKGFIKTSAKWLAYLIFFAAALVFFVYLTLPVDKAKDYLVRKAADEHQIDLDITQLSVVGLAGVQLEGVTLTPQPTPEQVEAFAKARDARKAWREAKKSADEAKKASDDDGENGDDATQDPALGKAPPSKPSSDAPGDTAKGKTDLAKGKAGKDPAKAKAKANAKKDVAPPLPEGPMPIYVERLTASVSPLSLMKGIIDGELDAELLGGTLNASLHKGSSEMTVKGTWSGLAVDQITTLRKKLGLPIAGSIEGEIDLEVPIDEAKLKLSKTTGHLDARIVNALMGPGQIATEKMGMLDVPKVRMSEFGGRLAFASRKATFENFVITGKDLEGDVQGYIQLADDIKRWGPRAHLQFKFSEAFLTKNDDVKTAFSGFPQLRRATNREGQTGVQLTGTFKDLKPRLLKTSVYRRKATRSAKKTAAKKKGKAAKKPSKRKPRSAKGGSTRGTKAGTRAGVAKGRAKAAPMRKPTKPMMVNNDEEEDTEDEDIEEDDEEEDEPKDSEDEEKKDDEEKKVDGEEGEEGDDEKKDDSEDEEKKDDSEE